LFHRGNGLAETGTTVTTTTTRKRNSKLITHSKGRYQWNRRKAIQNKGKRKDMKLLTKENKEENRFKIIISLNSDLGKVHMDRCSSLTS